MNIFTRFLQWLGLADEYFTDPDTLKIFNYKQHYNAQVKCAFWEAHAKLSNKGYCKQHKHKIEKFSFEPGTTKRPKGWAVWNGTMFVGGATLLNKIYIVVDPDTGMLNRSGYKDMTHEWGHALLDAENIHKGYWEEQHKILASVDL